MRERVAGEVHPAALPGGAEHARDGGLDALVGVGDDEFHAAQAAPRQLPKEGRPEGLGLGRTNIHPEYLAPAVSIDANGDNDGDRDDAAVLADLHVGRVDPQVRPIAFQWPLQERFHPLVDLLAQP